MKRINRNWKWGHWSGRGLGMIECQVKSGKLSVFLNTCIFQRDLHIFCKKNPLRGVFFLKTFRVYHVYCNFILGYLCWITVIFGTPEDGSLFINIFTSNNCFSYRNIFQNGVDTLSKLDDAFLTKS